MSLPAPALRLDPPAADPLGEGFDRIRRELGVPEEFPADALREADAAAARGPATPPGAAPGRRDRRDLDLVTIDPPGSRDLDQAVLIERRGGGFRVWYAIADVAAFVTPGGPLDTATFARGVTVYLPDRRSPLHPDSLGEGAASLLPGVDRPALLWTIDVDGEGRERERSVSVERAVVRSRRALTYAQAQAAIEGGGDEGLAALREVGLLRLAREAERGGVSLTVPVQEVVREGERYALRYEVTLPVEDWNAQVSLLTGICAARIMQAGGVGLFRTLAPAEPRALEGLRLSARALGVAWPQGASYQDVVRALDPARPGDAAFAVRASRTTGGAGYAAWDAGSPEPPPRHAAIAALYAHVTAPLRRLGDRIANEIVLALARGDRPPEWTIDSLPKVPTAMRETTSRARAAERAALDYVEAVVLVPRVGETFPAVVVDVRDGTPVVQIADPAVLAPLDRDGARAGDELRVRLVGADPQARRIVLTPA